MPRRVPSGNMEERGREGLIRLMGRLFCSVAYTLITDASRRDMGIP